MIEEQKHLEENLPESETLAQEHPDPTAETVTVDEGVDSVAPETEPEAELLTPEQMLPILAQEIDGLKQQLDQQTQQTDDLKKRYVTLAADFDNFRKRTAKEKQELEKLIKGKTLGELLSVVDNFERARTQLKPVEEGEQKIHKSYQSVYKNLVDSLKRLGVSPMRPEGQPFDPNYHEAMLREYTDDHPEGTVIEQLVRGYLLGDQVLRHAMVKVAAVKEPVIPSEAEKAEIGEINHPDD